MDRGVARTGSKRRRRGYRDHRGRFGIRGEVESIAELGPVGGVSQARISEPTRSVREFRERTRHAETPRSGPAETGGSTPLYAKNGGDVPLS